MDYRHWIWRIPEGYRETQPKVQRQDAHEKVSSNTSYIRDIMLLVML